MTRPQSLANYQTSYPCMPPIKRTKFKLTPEQLLEMFYWLKLIRAFDERLSILVKQGKVRSGVYTGIGQEAIIVGTCFGLRNEDYICPLHRDLGSFLMKGVEPRVMMSQMFAQDDRPVEGPRLGAAQRRHRARHLRQHQHARREPAGRGRPRLTFKMEKIDNVVVAYFGEGASNTGDFHEALNFAGVQQLPIVFVCENNQYAYSVPIEKSMAIDDVADRAESYGFDGVAINGNDVLAVYQSTQGALARARERRRPDADRVQDLPLARPLRARQGVLSDATKSWRCGRAAIRFRRSRPTCRPGTC